MQLEQEIPASVVVCVYVLGPLEVVRRDQSGIWCAVPKERWKNSKPARCVLKRLLVEPRRRLSREQLVDDVWSEEGEAEHDVYNAISLVRGVIGKALVNLSGSVYEVAGQSLVWTDLDACASLLREAEDRGGTTVEALPFLERALVLLGRGELLEGEYGRWCYGFRKRAEDMVRQARLWLAEGYEAQGKLWQAGEQYRALVLRDAADEEALRCWLEMLLRHGKRWEALRCYEGVKGVVQGQGFALSPEIEQAVTALSGQPRKALFVPPQIVQSSIESDQTKDMDTIRRRFLETSIRAAGMAPLFPLVDLDILERLSQALIKPLRLDETTFQYLEICTKQFWCNRQSAVFSSRDLYRPVNAHLQNMIALLEGSLLPAERMRLCNLLSQTLQLLGELSLDMGYYGQGKVFHQAALVAAQEAEDRFLTVTSWGRVSLACIYSKAYPDALTAIQTARSLVENHCTSMVLGWLAAIEAEIQAHHSQADLCLQALDDAEGFDKQLGSPLESYLVRFDRSLFGGYQGVCFRVLSHPEHDQSHVFLQKAQSSLRDALVSLDPLFLQRRPTLLADLAVVSIYQQDIEEACSLINQAATLATHMHLQKVTRRLVALREPLKPWNALAVVKTLDAHLAFLSEQGKGVNAYG